MCSDTKYTIQSQLINQLICDQPAEGTDQGSSTPIKSLRSVRLRFKATMKGLT